MFKILEKLYDYLTTLRGEDSDTLETLSDQIDGVPTTSEAEGYVENATDVATTHDITTANDKIETQVFEVAKAGIYALSVFLDLDALEVENEGGIVSFRLYNKIDGSVYSDKPSGYAEWMDGDDVYPSFYLPKVHGYCQLTRQCSDDVTATRTIAYRYEVRDLGA